MNSTILQIDSVTKSFVKNIVNISGKADSERSLIIDDLDLLVPNGKITALIGGNGAGKTTLFNIISGFTACDSGQIFYNLEGVSCNIISKPPHLIARLGIGRMFQDNHIFQNMTVLENMLVADSNFFGELPYTPLIKFRKNSVIENERVEKAQKIFVDLFGSKNPFWEMRDQQASILSFGQQRLLGLARLLMGNYNLLLLDEPTAGVNPKVIEQSMEIIRTFVSEKGLTVFLIEHNMKVVLDIADFCCFMSQGRMRAFGTPEDVIGDSDVRKTYLGI